MLASPRPLQIPSGQALGAGLPESLQLPASLCVGLRFSPEQFAELCQANPEAVLELAADGSLILMTPTGSETGGRNSALNALLWQALKRSGRWLRAEPRCLRGARRTLAGPQRRAAPRFRSPLP